MSTPTLDKSASINLRIDPAIKEEATEIVQSFGLTLTDAANIFFHKLVMTGGFPFELIRDTPNAETIAAIESDETVGPFNSTRELFAHLNQELSNHAL